MSRVDVEPKVEERPPRGRWGLLAEPDFRRLWIGETTSGLGTAVGNVALALVAVVTLGASPFMVGLLTASAWLPWLFLGLTAGAWVDRWPRRTVMLVCDLALLVLFASVPVAGWLGVLTIGQLVVVALLTGAVKVFFSTAYGAVVPSLVARPDLLEANVKLRAGESAVEIAGPGVAGVVSQLFGAATGMLLDAVTYLVSALFLGAIETREKPPARAARQSIVREIGEGVRFLVRDPYLRTLACFGAVGNLALNGIQAVQTVFLVRGVGLDQGGVGLVFAVVSVGGLVGASTAGRIARRFGTARGLLVCELVVAPFILLLPTAGRGVPLPVSVLAWSVAVCGVVAGNVIAGSFYQTYCPPEMIGRIRASASTVNYSAIPVGALLGGYLGGVLDSRTTIWIMSAVLLSAGLILLASPIRSLRNFPEHS
ncbi:MFS transporter [Kitasatospora herbaricolor]|uniref:MFS transporter n=1 Tax=Kitasatospora herbaricolor TaxID=68217 RepID=UPI001748E216|nr:MFS transporter [Kitasatospora herbaricolor]MDQ0313149.1 MFS family permease [Kitasatospora herbaricolor]GGV20817.1 MFS transporter [Kitasatospora herbaricolor]